LLVDDSRLLPMGLVAAAVTVAQLRKRKKRKWRV
jgi:hypothetical protein